MLTQKSDIPASGNVKPGGGGTAEPDVVSNQDVLLEIKSLKKVIYRIIKERCRITDEDVNDPDSGISLQTKYDDRILHPEKYRKNN